MVNSVGSISGLLRRATILKYNGDGTVQIRLDERSGQQTSPEYRVPMPMSWGGPDGEFMGGYPVRGSSVTVKSAQGGQWFIESVIPSRSSFGDSGKMNDLREGRAVMQVKGGTNVVVDPSAGVLVGNGNQKLQADPNRGLISHTFAGELKFTQAMRGVNSIVARDLKDNASRGMLGSALTSHSYNDALTPIGMDVSASASFVTQGGAIRNAALSETRNLYYEFGENFNVGTDEEESQRVTESGSAPEKINNGKREMRSNAMSLSLQYPNHLIEQIAGTVVDSAGNVLDLNRSILPIGKIDELSLRKNPDKTDAFARIRAMMRKSLAYHFELNARKPGIIDPDTGAEGVAPVPDVDDFSDYGRSRSRFFLDLDKEGQMKLNVPASSETGNVPMLVRYENYSNLLAKKDPEMDPDAFIKNKDRQDIYLDGFAGKPGIKLSGSDTTLDGYESPINRVDDSPMLLGTAFHEITKACFAFLPDAKKPVLYEANPLVDDYEPYEKLVEDTIIVSGKDANAGGRSGLFSFDGFMGLNVGANTSDRQSMWIDCAGGVVTMLGRDRRGISHAMQLDGDLIIQVGGPGVGNTYDSRFADLNDGARIGAIDIRLMDGDRPTSVLRIDKNGFRAVTEGVFQIQANQGIALNTHGNLSINGERVAFFTNTGLTRIVERSGVNI
jgi:hypothetical protein